ncbi:MAG: amino acid permease, partial [Deltaproteobacteria bacterium]|nr:amino acid permease [Deltaproteobacteria bacterium]
MGENKAKVGLFGSTMVGVGAMVGAGIFVLCGVALRAAGPGAMLAFALNGVITLITAFSFAELAATFPEAGGGYVFAKKVFPIGAAFAAGWVLWFAYVVAAALYALGFAGFVAYTLQVAFDMHLPNGAKIAIAASTAVLSVGMILRQGAGAGGWISVGKMIAFLVLIVTGIVVLFGRP